MVRGHEITSPGLAGAPSRCSALRLGARAARRCDSVAQISPLLLGWFTWYSRRYLRRHFHSLRISRSGFVPKAEGFPLVIYSNHASWFDPLVGLVLKKHCFPRRKLSVPMDAAALARYGFFRKLGFFPVEQKSTHGTRQFLRAALEMMKSPHSVLAVTPQSRFADVRERPVKFAGGLGLLATRVERAVFVPLALEYVFWEERLPEIFVRFGAPTTIGSGSGNHSAAEWTAFFETRMAENQDALAFEAQRRDPASFENILRGGAGQGGVYDWWRALKARFRGESFPKEHGNR